MLAEIEWENLIVEPVREMLTRLIGYLPTLLGALIILIIGWIVAKVIKGIVNRILTVIRFNKLADKAGISEILSKGGLEATAGEVLSGLVYWLVSDSCPGFSN